MLISRKPFFDAFRTFHKAVRHVGLTTSQVAGLTSILDHIDADTEWERVEHVAYLVATIAHETAWTFEPIREYRGKTLSAAQKRYWPSGYFGRGYVQLTWDYNYEKAGHKLGVDLVNHPDLALEPETAYRIAATGMREGWFTGKKLSTYINETKTDYVNARRIINGTDKAALIAGYAKSIEKCLSGSLEAKDAPVEPQETAPKTVTATVQAPAVEVPQAEPAKAEEPKVSGFKTQWAALTTFLTVSGGSIITWLSGVKGEIIIGLAAVVTIIGITYMITRYLKLQRAETRAHDEKMQREKQAFELTVLQMKSAMSKSDNTVIVVPTPIVNSEPEVKQGDA